MLGNPYIDAALVSLLGVGAVAVWRFIGRSLRRELHAVIEEVVQPELTRIHERIDAHMESEEGDLKRLIEVLADLAGENSEEIKRRITGE